MDSDQDWSDLDAYSDDDDKERVREGGRNSPGWGNAPYRFEPLPIEPEANEVIEGEEPPNQPDRINNIGWCLCGMCRPMPTQEESICCQEYQLVIEKCKSEEDPPSCITEHPGFSAVCLNTHVLVTAYHGYRQVYGATNKTLEQRQRYTAYRQFIRWIFEFLGKDIRVPIPSCVVNRIRMEFPSTHYSGFKTAYV